MRAPRRTEALSSTLRGRAVAVTAVAAVGALLGSLALAAVPGSTASPSTRAGLAPVAARGASQTPAEPIRVVQANLESPQSAARFTADMATVMAQKPDLITYNEVAYRSDAQLAPAGYAMFRTPGKYTGETPVAWNTARYHALATGTYLVSNSTAKTAAQKVMLGMRYANWATLADDEGRVVSLVSAHTAPNGYPVAGLVGPSMVRIAKLVDTLRASGPVIVGGDLNMQYKGSRYQAATFAAHDMTPTFDILGTTGPTHDAGGTVDYLFLSPATDFTVEDHYLVDLNSDHKLLGADLTPAYAATAPGAPSRPPSGPPASGPVVSPPSGRIHPGTITNARRPRPGTVTRRIISVLDQTPTGAAVHVASARISGSSILQALLRADRRGVKVQVLSGSAHPTSEERRLQQVLGSDLRGGSWARVRPRSYSRSGLARTAVLASQSMGTPAVRIATPRPLSRSYQARRYEARVTTSLGAYDATFQRFFQAAGRPL